MKWPWVSRELYDAVQGVANRLVIERQDDATRYADLLANYDALVQQIVTMRKEGFVAEPKAPPAPPAREPLPPVVVAAIAQRSQPNTKERRLLDGTARQLLDEGMNAESAAADILAGEPVTW